MNTRHHTAAALASAILIAAGTSAGCSSEVESAQSPAPLAAQAASVVSPEAGEGIQALTQRVNWARMDVAPQVQGF